MRRVLLAVLVATALPARAVEPTLVALLDDGAFVVFRRGDAAPIRTLVPKGLTAKLVGIDRRPADGLLYGLAGGAEVSIRLRGRWLRGHATLAEPDEAAAVLGRLLTEHEWFAKDAWLREGEPRRVAA